MIIILPFENNVKYAKEYIQSEAPPKVIANHKFYKFHTLNASGYFCITKAGIGPASLLVDIGVMKLRAKRVISIGVAGSLSEEFKPGDIATLEKAACHDCGRYMPDGSFKHAPSRWYNFNRDEFLAELNSQILGHYTKKSVDIKMAAIASGNSFISSDGKRKSLNDKLNADLVDMNAVAIAANSNQLNVPCYGIRFISDNANGKAREDFASFIPHAEEINELIEVILNHLNRDE